MAKKESIDLYNEPFPTKLRELMDEQDKTQAELANSIGVSRQSVSKYTSGTAYPNVQALAAITDFFNVSADYLLGKSPSSKIDPQMRAACEYTGLSEQTIGIIKDLEKSDDAKYYDALDFKPPLAKILDTLFEEGIMTGLINAVENFVLFTSTGELTFRYTRDKPKSIPIDPKIIAEWFLDMELERATEKIKETMLNKYADLYKKKDSL